MNDSIRPIVSAYAAVRGGLAAVAATGLVRQHSDGTLLAVSDAPVATLNGVVSPHPKPSAQVIERLAGDCEQLRTIPWSIQVRGVPGQHMVRTAAHFGLTTATTLPLMVRPKGAGVPPRLAGNPLRVRPVRGHELEFYARLMEEGFGTPSGLFEAFSNPALGESEGFLFYAAEVEGVPVGTGMAAVSDDLLGLFNISVLPRYRRRGHGSAITSAIVRAGHEAGATTAYLYSSAMGESVYASAGFRTEEVLTAFTAPPASSGSPLPR
ncbi:GNAT family N-acetyltransferase [Streptomyces sp. NPDC002306]